MPNLYDAPEPEPETQDAGGGDGSPEGGQEQDGQTALVNKELCPDCKPGEKLIVEVLQDHGKEIEIRYVGKEGEGQEEMGGGEPEPEPDGGGNPLMQ